MYSLYKNENRIFKPVQIIIRRGLRKKQNKTVFIQFVIPTNQ
jgi:hypothetical protein